MGKYVVSTLTRPNKYCDWETTSGIGTITREVLVHGGAGMARGGADGNFITPDGVRTEVSNEDAEFLAQHPLFQEHQKRGFVKIIPRADDPDKVAQGMESKDPSRPATAATVEKYSDDLKKKTGSERLTVVTNRKRA